MKSKTTVLLVLAVVAVLLAPFTRGLSLVGALPVLATAPLHLSSDVHRQLIAWGIMDYAGGILRKVVIKTADYTILSGMTTDGTGDASGTIFTNRGAGADVIFTLPAPVPALKGTFYEFLGIADFAITVKTATVDTLIALNDATADSVAQSTATKLIGSHMKVICDGTSWAAYGDAVGGTFTIAT